MEEEAAPELVYTEFEDLTDENCQLSEVVDNLYSKDWTVVFQALNQLRAINKYRWDELIAGFQTYITPVVQQLDNLRSGLARNALLLATEVFYLGRVGGDVFLEPLLPILMLKAVNEKAFIRNQALTALDYITQNYQCELLIRLLADHCFVKNGEICDLSIKLLEPLLYNAPNQIAFQVAVQLLESKRGLIITAARNVLIRLKDLEEFEQWTSELDESMQNKIHYEVNVKNSERMDVRSLIRQQRKKAKKGKKGKKVAVEFELVE